MSNSIESITKAEERLRLAMLSSDVNTLDELLAPELIFTNHFGQALEQMLEVTNKLQIQNLTIEVVTE